MVISQPENKNSEFGRYEIWWVVGLIVIGLTLRFFRISYWSIWIEENHLMRDVQIYMETFSAIYNNPRPIFYLLVLPFFNGFGVDLGIARMVSSVIGIISIPLLYILSRRALGRQIALIATFLFVFAPWHIFWSQNARFYTLLLVFYSLSYVFFYLTL
ncbi:MAG: glycosyltransferase family 39 protein, partial [Chloroflexota bacterium]